MTALTVAAPALAAEFAAETSEPISDLAVLGIYVGLPLLIFGLIAFFIWAPGLVTGPRYRPGRDWGHDAWWFAGPRDPEPAVEAARPGGSTGGSSAGW